MECLSPAGWADDVAVTGRSYGAGMSQGPHPAPSNAGVQALVIVVSAWHDDDGMRARLVCTHGARPGTQVCRSVDEVVKIVRTALTEWGSEGRQAE